MSKGKQLIKNTIIIVLGDFIPKLIGLILLPLYTTWLTKTEYGTYEFINSIISLLLPLITLQIGQAVFRFIIDEKDDRIPVIISNGFYAILFSNLICIFLALVMLKSLDVKSRIILIIYFIFRGFVDYVRNICRGLSNFKLYSISIAVFAILNLISSPIFVIYLKMGLNGLIISLIIAEGLTFLFVMFKGKLYNKISYRYISFKEIKLLINYSLPLVPNKISWWFVNLSDRMIITAFLGFNMNAIYAIANKIPSLYSTFYNTFNLAWQESASVNSEDNDYFKKVFDSLFKFLVSSNIFLISITPIIYKMFVSSQYESAKIFSLILYIALFFSTLSSFLGGILIAKKDTKILGIMTLLSAIINIILNLLFIKKIGLYAPSLSALVSYFILFIQRYKYVNDNVTKIKINKTCVFISLIFTVSIAILYYFESWINVSISLLLVFVYIRIYSFDIIKNLFKIVIKQFKLKRKGA